MARTAFTAPAHIVAQRQPAQAPNAIPPDSAPSLVYGGAGLLDHRLQFNRLNNGSSTGAMCIGWINSEQVITSDIAAANVPTAAATANIAALQNVPAGLALTLVSVAGPSVWVNTAPFISYPFGNTIPSGALCLGGNQTTSTAATAQPQYLRNGIRDVTAWYDPTTSLSLAVQITGSASSAGQNFTVRGYDFYGQAMSEVIAGPAGATTTAGKKAFKWIVSVTGTSAEAQNYSVGTTLIAGFHLAVDSSIYAAQSTNNVFWALPGTFVAALTSAAPTATNADVRGTCVITANQNLRMMVSPSAARLTGVNSYGFTQAPTPLSVGLFGQTQFTN